MKVKAIENMSTNQIIEVFIMTEQINDKNIPTVRGWLMDELEKRNPDAFDRWLDESAEDEDLVKYYA